MVDARCLRCRHSYRGDEDGVSRGDPYRLRTISLHLFGNHHASCLIMDRSTAAKTTVTWRAPEALGYFLRHENLYCAACRSSVFRQVGDHARSTAIDAVFWSPV